MRPCCSKAWGWRVPVPEKRSGSVGRGGRRAARALLGLLACLLASVVSASDLEGLKDGVVEVRAGGRTGSGLLIEVQDNVAYVLTAYHVILGELEPEVSFFRDPHRRAKASVVKNQYELEDAGLSILRVTITDRRGLEALRFSQSADTRPQEPVFAVGFYGGGQVPWSVTEGRVIGESGGALLFTGAIEEGNSGGPLIQDGEVVGVVTQKGLSHHFATPARAAQVFAENTVGVLPVYCNVPLIPRKTCEDRLTVDRRSCDHIRSANALYVDGDYERAVQEYNRAITSQPRAAVLFNNRGAVKATMRDFLGAADDFARALQIDPDYTVAEVNQTLIETYRVFFDWAENGEPSDEFRSPILGLLEGLRGEGPGDHSVPGAAGGGLFGGVLEVLAEAGRKYHDHLRFEDQLQNFDQGDFACYGGDIIAANNELSPELARELAGYLRQVPLMQ